MYLLITLACFTAAIATQFNLTRSAKLAEVRRFRALGVSDDRAKQFYRDTALQAFTRRWPSILLHGVLLTGFCLAILWFVAQ